MARATSSFGDQRADRVERRGAHRGSTASCASAAALERQRLSSARTHVVAQARRARDAPRRSSRWPRQSRAAAAPAARASAALVADGPQSRARARAPLPRGARLRRDGRAPARPAPACAARASARALAQRLRLVARLEQPPLRVGQPLVGRRCSSSSRAIDCLRLGLTRVEAGDAPPRPRRSRRDQLRLLRDARASSSAARCTLRLEADDRLLLPVMLGRQRRDGRRGLRRSLLDVGEPRPRVASDARALARRRRSRSSLISRLVARMPRGFGCGCRRDDQVRAAEDVAVDASRPARRCQPRGRRAVEGSRDPRVADRRMAQRCARTAR